MPKETLPLPDGLAGAINGLGLGTLVEHRRMAGGSVNEVNRVATSAGVSLVTKHGAGVASDLYQREAEGLAALAAAGFRVPEVVAVDAEYIVLEDVGDTDLADIDWEALGRAVASLHLNVSDSFGFDADNYIGSAGQANPWTSDGHEFFAQYRVIDLLSHPLCEQYLTADDRRGVERFAGRVRSLLPAQPAVLLHGDLYAGDYGGSWMGNLLVAAGGQPILIDPAVYYGWAEADLTTFRLYGASFPGAFTGAYLEVNPLPDGWEERLDILGVHDYLVCVATTEHLPDLREFGLGKLREALARFA